ncbi:MAG: TRAP transporter large permease subunit [Albidovulum sp.]|nr:TRAP transporter large permease subunit [Albidovulum sp.]MDE0308113.1 TRAP transporter large permease subunit [Albidovulum sp.]MDE0532987.1 TRAP transporter large permease subunit [Albidovulum sp.]
MELIEWLDMGPLEVAFTTLGLLALYLVLGVWVFAAVGLVGLTTLYFLLGFDIDRIGAVMRGTMWRSASTWELSAVPIFVLMGELMYRSDMSERLFRGLAPWVARIPGGLLHTNIAGCTIFAAVSGSTTATTATVGKITTGALAERKYDQGLSIGSLAGAGSLGLMIPPSISFIIYGVLSESSIARLFAAGVFPGLLIAGLYSGYIGCRAVLNPALAPRETDSFTMADRLSGLLDLLPVTMLVFVVLGSLYSGVATPSEAAAVGFLGAFVLVLSTGQLTLKLFVESVAGTIKITTMGISILVAANFMSSAMAYLHVPQEIAKFIVGLGLSKYSLILLVAVFYIILGLFLDGLSIMVMTLPITLPLIVAAGFDPIWFGVFIVIMIELGLVTPPIGFNLFVLQVITGRPMSFIAKAAFPFFLLLCIAAAFITAFPRIALWLPDILFNK